MREKVLNTTNHLENANQNNQNANHLTPVRMVIIKKTRTSSGYDTDHREPWYTISKNVNYIATVENNMLVPQEGKIELPYDPAIPSLGIYPKETKLLSQKDICTPMFTASLYIIAKTRNSLIVHQEMNG